MSATSNPELDKISRDLEQIIDKDARMAGAPPGEVAVRAIGDLDLVGSHTIRVAVRINVTHQTIPSRSVPRSGTMRDRKNAKDAIYHELAPVRAHHLKPGIAAKAIVAAPARFVLGDSIDLPQRQAQRFYLTGCRSCVEGKVDCDNRRADFGLSNPSHRHVERCFACHGAGTCICSKCSGTGQVQQYDGRGNLERVHCSQCQGSGRGGYCNGCGGRGFNDCSKCNGSGKIVCPTCGGTTTIGHVLLGQCAYQIEHVTPTNALVVTQGFYEQPPRSHLEASNMFLAAVKRYTVPEILKIARWCRPLESTIEQSDAGALMVEIFVNVHATNIDLVRQGETRHFVWHPDMGFVGPQESFFDQAIRDDLEERIVLCEQRRYTEAARSDYGNFMSQAINTAYADDPLRAAKKLKSETTLDNDLIDVAVRVATRAVRGMQRRREMWVGARTATIGLLSAPIIGAVASEGLFGVTTKASIHIQHRLVHSHFVAFVVLFAGSFLVTGITGMWLFHRDSRRFARSVIPLCSAAVWIRLRAKWVTRSTRLAWLVGCAAAVWYFDRFFPGVWTPRLWCHHATLAVSRFFS